MLSHSIIFSNKFMAYYTIDPDFVEGWEMPLTPFSFPCQNECREVALQNVEILNEKFRIPRKGKKKKKKGDQLKR